MPKKSPKKFAKAKQLPVEPVAETTPDSAKRGKIIYILAILLCTATIVIFLSNLGSDKPANNIVSTANSPVTVDSAKGIDLGESGSGFSQSQASGSVQQGGSSDGSLQLPSGQVQNSANSSDPAVDDLLKGEDLPQGQTINNCHENINHERPSYCLNIPPPIQ